MPIRRRWSSFAKIGKSSFDTLMRRASLHRRRTPTARWITSPAFAMKRAMSSARCRIRRMPAANFSAVKTVRRFSPPSLLHVMIGRRDMRDEKTTQFAQPTLTTALVASHGLTPEEYQKILKILGREPTYTELGVFSVMWSEHCSYKSSRHYLKLLPTEGPRVLQGPGENAGVVDIGGGLAVAFRSEERRV